MITQQNTDIIREIAARGNLTFFMGAGVSIGSGLPDWKQLVSSMYFRYMEAEDWRRVPYPNYLYAISNWYMTKTGESLDIVVRKLKSMDQGMFDNTLWAALYGEHFDPAVIQGNHLLHSLATKIAIRPGMRSVITYNFDDLLETALKHVGFSQFDTVFKAGKPALNTVPVFHVHGYVPFSNNPGKSAFGNIMLSEEDYHNLASEPYHWANQVQMSALTSGTNVFIGMSLTDRNLRRMLHILARAGFASDNYVFLKKNPLPQLMPEDINAIEAEAQKIMEKWQTNAYIKAVSKREHEIISIMKKIYTFDMENDRNILEQLNITPIWFDDYNDLPQYISLL